MKKSMFLVITMFILGLNLFGTLIPDDNFRRSINMALEQASDYQPTEADLNGITHLSGNFKNIASIEGAQFLINLTQLWLQGNQISDITAIDELTNLTHLLLSGNLISDITPVSNLTNLIWLTFNVNQITDISSIANLTNLTIIGLNENQIMDISAISNLVNLQELHLGDNQIIDISPTSSLISLNIISLYSNMITNILAISGLENLNDVFLFGNQITDLSPLVENSNFNSGHLKLYYEYSNLSNQLSQEAINVQIPILQNRGISVTHEETPNNNVACYPNPARNVSEVGLYIPLQWKGNFGRNASYEVWLGESSNSLINIGNGNHISETNYFIISSLNPNTQYWWKVKATYESEEVWSGLWNFTTGDGTSPATQEQTIPANDQTEQIFADVSTTIQFAENHIGTELEITETFTLPNIVGNLPVGIENVASRFWSVVSSAGNIGNYEITFDLSGVGGIQNFGTLRFLKRENNASVWQDVVADLGATLIYNEAEMKITIQGLDAFSEFAPAGGGDNTLPVELSSFTAVQTTSNFAQINWQTQTETNLMGYNIYRNLNNSTANSVIINNSLISGTNTSSAQNYSFIDEEVENETEYFYWLESIDLDGTSTLFGPTSVKIENPDQPEDTPDLSCFTEIRSVYPNPFNPSTTISFSLNSERSVKISVYNTKGQLIKKLVDGIREKGNHSVIWNGKDSNNKIASSGVYFFKMITGNKILTEKAILLK